MAKSLLPEDARQILIKASQTPVTAHDPLARIRAIESAEATIKKMYPYLFREDEYEPEN